MLILNSLSLDVFRNLAIEEYLIENAEEPILFLWRSASAVVVGKNQNPWRECRLDRMRNEGVELARRVSGGGAVYHDVGNLNYCVVVDRLKYREEQAYEMVFQALGALGVRAERMGKSSLGVRGEKFSGNAFCFRKGRALHHGTLLLDTDLERLNRYLGPMFDRIETRAIPSVPAKVMNLKLDVDEVSLALRDSFSRLYDGGALLSCSESDLDKNALSALIEKQGSDDWLFATTPRFFVEKKGVRLEIEKGRVVRGFGRDAERWVGMLFSEIVISLSCWID